MPNSALNQEVPPLNPFQSPTANATEPEPRGEFVPPSLRLISGCVVCSLVLTAASHSAIDILCLDLSVPYLIWFTAFVLLGGTISGLGIALLIQAITLQQLSRLVPGHWRLIAAVATLVAQCLDLAWMLLEWILPSLESANTVRLLLHGSEGLLACIWYFVVLQTTRETPMWRNYAWLCAVW